MENRMSILDNCPCCGDIAIFGIAEGIYTYWVHCVGCGLRTPTYTHIHTARNRWNRRIDDRSIRSRKTDREVGEATRLRASQNERYGQAGMAGPTVLPSTNTLLGGVQASGQPPYTSTENNNQPTSKPWL